MSSSPSTTPSPAENDPVPANDEHGATGASTTHADRNVTVDEALWATLQREAHSVAQRAYAPYSGFGVGAAAVTTDGRIVTGTNVENLSYGLTLCAECGLVSALHASGGGQLLAVVVVSRSGEPCSPCGRCRQLLAEHAAPGCLIDGTGERLSVDDLLPGRFDAARYEQG